MRRRGFCRARLAIGVWWCWASVCGPAFAEATSGEPLKPGRETIVFIRHGEKPPLGLGQLSCQGLNRALALPGVIQAKFGAPTAFFAPDPSTRKSDAGRLYDYVRPLATIEPSAIRFGLPVDTTHGFSDLKALQDALEQPALRDATVIVAWEHKVIVALLTALLQAHGNPGVEVPRWDDADYDGMAVLTIDWDSAAAGGSRAALTRDHQGLDGLPTSCPTASPPLAAPPSTR